MKSEILYIQAGSFANFIGSHFWNTQDSYFTYEDGDDPLVFHDRSFREGLTAKGEPTYCPRLLLFDTKSQFGAISNDLYHDGDVSEGATQWEGDVVEYRQDAIAKSEYHKRLEEEEENDDTEIDGSKRERDIKIRFWSDYTRVYFHPRSLLRLADTADWQSADGDWSTSRQTFQSYDSEHDLMENETRLFVEECDNLQGIHFMNDCVTFGGFTDAFLTAFRDEFPKLPSLAFPLLSSASHSNTISSAEEDGAMKALNDALCLRGLESLSTMHVPIQDPSTWQKGEWREDLNLDINSRYHTSALLSTHIESVTLPLRLKTSVHDLLSITSLLNPSGSTRMAHLSGAYPYPHSVPTAHAWSPTDVEKRVYDLSASQVESRQVTYARLHVSRGLDPREVKLYEESFAEKITPNPLSIHAPPYPIPTSFPHLAPKESEHRVLSGLTTSTAPARLFSSYARLAQECVDRRAEVVIRMGLEYDELRELKDDLWALADAYAGDYGERGGEEEDERGEDED